MATIINLTQHVATSEQVAEGVVDLPPEQRKQLTKLLTLDTLPTYAELRLRAVAVGDLVEVTYGDLTNGEFLIGGAPFLMGVLADHLGGRFEGRCLYAFSQRVSVEDPVTGVKTSVFRHEGFVPHYEN